MADKPSQLSDPVGISDNVQIATLPQLPGYHPIHRLPDFLKEKLAKLDLAAAQMIAKAEDI